MSKIKGQSGFTLIELVAVIIIVGILAAIAAQKIGSVAENIKAEETMREMDLIAKAVVGNELLYNNGMRSDFGYVGDIGAFPPNLDALISNPGLGTWNGPYIKNSFEQISSDYKQDSWQANYTLSGIQITSSGSGSNIVKYFSGSVDEILYNSIEGNIFDLDGTPPGDSLNAFILVRMTFPDGTGSYSTISRTPDNGGHFQFDSIPIGNHTLEIIYTPSSDTLRHYVSVSPGSALYEQNSLTTNEW
ncbi:MAG: prepilin-type N-terminal cleavage/methylation domain-containing protein [Candidatus Zixiibacteriota bacterium]